jgi:hypothetical protein
MRVEIELTDEQVSKVVESIVRRCRTERWNDYFASHPEAQEKRQLALDRIARASTDEEILAAFWDFHCYLETRRKAA